MKPLPALAGWRKLLRWRYEEKRRIWVHIMPFKGMWVMFWRIFLLPWVWSSIPGVRFFELKIRITRRILNPNQIYLNSLVRLIRFMKKIGGKNLVGLSYLKDGVLDDIQQDLLTLFCRREVSTKRTCTTCFGGLTNV